MRAADRFHCPPWELLAQGRAWLELALVAQSAEAGAEREIAETKARRERARRMMRGGR